jgi:hypothetical protein
LSLSVGEAIEQRLKSSVEVADNEVEEDNTDYG